MDDRVQRLEDERAALTREIRVLRRRVAELEKAEQRVVDAYDDLARSHHEMMDETWRLTILARKPGYGDWDYPGFWHRHLRAEWQEIMEELSQLRREAQRDQA